MLNQLYSKSYLVMEDEEILKKNLTDMLIVLGSYLYEGAELQDIDPVIFCRLSELIDNQLEGFPENISIH